jgi:uncharacterized FlaG/YvyC family protein
MALDSLTTGMASTLKPISFGGASTMVRSSSSDDFLIKQDENVNDAVSSVAKTADLDVQSTNLVIDDLQIDRLNESLGKAGSNILFEPDVDSGKMLFVMKDATTGEIIRQIPNEVVLKISQAVNAYLSKVQLDTKSVPGSTLNSSLSGLITNLMV